MEVAPTSAINSRTTIASCVLIFAGPAASFAIGSPLRSEPVLQLVVLFGALFGLFSLFFPGIIAFGIVDGTPEMSPAQSHTLSQMPAATIVLDCLLHDVFRILMVWLLILCEKYFRSQGGQVMYVSKFRLLPLGVAAGFGFGLLRGMCIVASSTSTGMVVDTTTTNAGFVPVAPASVGLWTDVESCAAMPLVVHQTVGHLLALIGDVAWTVLIFPILANSGQQKMYKEEEEFRAEQKRLKEEESNNSNKNVAAAASSASSPSTTDEQSEGGENNNNNNNKKKKKQKRVIPPRNLCRIPRLYYSMTNTSSAAEKQQIGFAVISIATHIVFGLCSLLNNDAFDWTTYSVVTTRGCTISLPIQGVVVLIAVVAALYLSRLEQVVGVVGGEKKQEEPTTVTTKQTLASSSPQQVVVATSPSTSEFTSPAVPPVSDSDVDTIFQKQTHPNFVSCCDAETTSTTPNTDPLPVNNDDL